jgi:hypothetical protein
VIGNGVAIATNSATFTLNMSDTNGLSTNVGICAYTIKNTAGVNTGTGEGKL